MYPGVVTTDGPAATPGLTSSRQGVMVTVGYTSEADGPATPRYTSSLECMVTIIITLNRTISVSITLNILEKKKSY